MKKVILAVAAVALLAVPATAAARADGQCVSKGVKLLGGPAIAAAATGQVLPGVNAVPIVIKDHAFNNANVTEQLLGVEICS